MALRKKKHSHSNDKKRVIEHNGLYPYMTRFLEWGKVIEGVSKDTTKRRDSALRRFIEWCDDRDIHDPRMITMPILERYQRHLYYYRKADGNPLTSGSQNVIISPLKTFFKWLTREHYINSNPASELILPKKPKRLPKNILHVDEVNQLLKHPNLETPEGIRDRAVLEMLYSTGIRRMELCNLSIYDLDAKRQAVMICAGKGNKDRVVPIGQLALDWVHKYLDEVRPLLTMPMDKDRLFLTDYGEPFTRSVLSGHVKKIMKAAKLDKPGSCHLLRHAMATHMLENGADTRIIQAILGHADLNSTQIYTQVSIEQLKKIHAATHPSQRSAEDKTLH